MYIKVDFNILSYHDKI